MIEKFNFYDVYGYFLPGFALAALLYLPFGLIRGQWPSATLADGVAAIIVVYLAGHVLQTVALHAVPSQTKDPAGAMRFPSDILLDEEDANFSQEFKNSLAELVSKAFQIDLGLAKPARAGHVSDHAAVSRQRQDAFFLCRSALISGKVAGYPEQFEGMYSLMRGLAAAFAAGFFYLLGWALPGRVQLSTESVRIAIALAIILAIALAAYLAVVARVPAHTHNLLDQIIALTWMLLFLAAGYLLSSAILPTSGGDNAVRIAAALAAETRRMEFAGIALASLFCALRCLAAYKYFASEFAKGVWRGFAGFQLSAVAHGSKAESE